MSLVPGTTRGHDASLGAVARSAAFDVAFWWAVAFCLLALLPALLLPGALRAPKPAAPAPASDSSGDHQ